LIEQRGRDGKVADLLAEVSADWPATNRRPHE
jgi:hypothetical protein